MDKDNPFSIESLRSDVENEYRFKSVYRGYDKKSVNAYIGSFKKETESLIEKLKEDVRTAEFNNDEIRARYAECQEEVKSIAIRNQKEIEILKSKYEAKLRETLQEKSQQLQDLETEMNKKIEEVVAQKDKEILNLNTKLKNREETEKKLQESAIEGYKVANARLTEENNKKTVRISELEEKLSLAKSSLDNNIKMLDTLNARLNEMLSIKFSECEDILSVWSNQFNETSGMLRNQLTVDND